MKTKTYIHVFFFLALLVAVSACSSNPVDPLQTTDPLAGEDAVQKKRPFEEVTYLIWSEKGIRAEVAMSMWIPKKNSFAKERIMLADQPISRTFSIHPDQHRDVDFALYNLTEQTIVRAFILIDGEVVAGGDATGSIPILSLDTRERESCHIGMIPCAMPKVHGEEALPEPILSAVLKDPAP